MSRSHTLVMHSSGGEVKVTDIDLVEKLVT